MRMWQNGCVVVVVLSAVLGQSRPSRGIGDGGLATKAVLDGPTGLALGDNGLYIVESSGGRVRRVDLKTGIITTIAGGGRQCGDKDDGSSPKFGCLSSPQRITVSGGKVYLTDDEGVIEVGPGPNELRTIVPASDEQALDRTSEQKTVIEWPEGIVADMSGGLFFDDHSEHKIYHMRLQDNSWQVIGGDGKEGFKGNGGPSRDAEFRFPSGLALDDDGNLFIADEDNCRIQRIDSKTGIVTTVVGTAEGGATCEEPGGEVSLDSPTDVAVDPSGTIFFVQEFRDRVRRFDPRTGSISTVAGTGDSGFSGDGGPATKAKLHFPQGLVVGKDGKLYISDTSNNRVRRVDLKTGLITTVAGNGPEMGDIQL